MVNDELDKLISILFYRLFKIIVTILIVFFIFLIIYWLVLNNYLTFTPQTN
jgi:hypothetical protein